MRSITSLVLCIYLSGCTSSPALSPYEHGDRLLDSGKYHEAFLFWPIWEEYAKNIAEGGLGRARYMLINLTAISGQKDWIDIFKNPKIPMKLKHELLWEIHEGAVRGRKGPHDCWDWDEIERTHARLAYYNTLENEDQEGWSLHGELLAYITEQNPPVDNERAALERMGKLHGLVYAIRRSKVESELPNIFMDSRIPLSIKAYLILMLQK